MPGPKLPPVAMTADERAALEQLVRRHTTGQQLAERARIVLLAAAVLIAAEHQVGRSQPANTLSFPS